LKSGIELTLSCCVAYSFGKGAYEEAARVKNQEGVEIVLRTVQELLDGKVEE